MSGRTGLTGGMGRRRRIRAVRVRQSRAALALAAAILGFGVFSSAVGTGALPTESLPAFGVTNGDGSLSTVAELGDVNGDGFGDYAVGLPSSDLGGTDSGAVYVFLGHGGALPSSPAAVNLATASFRITGHGGEMLGYSIAGDDVNGDGRADIAIGAPMAGPPSKSGGGAVYVVFGRANPVNVDTTDLSPAAYSNAATNPAPPSALGSRYDGFQPNGHFGMSLAALPDVNGDGYNDLAAGSPDAALHRPGGGGVAVLYGQPQGVHITLNDLWEAGYPYFFHVDFPALDDQHVGTTVASVGDMTGDGEPDIAIGAPQADFNGAPTPARSGSSARTSRRSSAARRPSPTGTCPWIKLNSLTAGQGYRIDGAAAGDQLGTSLAGVGDQNGDGIRDLAIGAAGASPSGRAGAGEVVVVPGQSNSATRNLAATPPLQDDRRPASPARASAPRWRPRATSTATAASTCSPARRARRPRPVPPTSCAARRHDLRPRAGLRQDRPGRRRRDDRQQRRGRLVARRRRRRRARGGAGRERLRRAGSWSAAAARRCCRRRPARPPRRPRRPRPPAAPARGAAASAVAPGRAAEPAGDDGATWPRPPVTATPFRPSPRRRRPGQARRQEKEEEAAALPAQEAQAEVQASSRASA